MPFQLQIVAMVLVWVDHMLLIECSDGSLVTLKCSYKPDDFTLNSWRYLPTDALSDRVKEYSRNRHADSNARLHAYKTHTYGEGYAQRGY